MMRGSLIRQRGMMMARSGWGFEWSERVVKVLNINMKKYTEVMVGRLSGSGLVKALNINMKKYMEMMMGRVEWSERVVKVLNINMKKYMG
jgi:hypothetical protein